MPVRPSMATLIGRLRTLISDPSAAAFADQDVQNFLDARQTVLRYAVLQPEVTVTQSGSQVQYLDFYSGYGDFESDWQIVDPSWNIVTPQTTDELVGHWTFAAGQLWPLRITGKIYDLYGSAADALEAWAAKVALDFDFSTDGQSFKRSQKAQALRDLADQYRRRARAQVAHDTRSDTYGDTAGIYPYVGFGWEW